MPLCISSDNTATVAEAAASDANAAPSDSGLLVIAAGQTETAGGIVRADVTLNATAELTEAASGSLAIFGEIDGPEAGTATIEVAAGATLYPAGAVSATVVAGFADASGTLELAALYLPGMSGSIANFSAGDVIDIISGTITDAVLTSAGADESLVLLDEGVPIGSLALAGAPAGGSVFAIPDAIDGTRILLGPAMPQVSDSAPAPAPAPSSGLFAWGAAASGQWGDAGEWLGPGGNATTEAPGLNDAVSIAGPQTSVLAVAGEGAAASLATQGLVALAGSFAIGSLEVGASSLDALVLTPGCVVMAATATLDTGVLQIAAADATLDVTAATTLQGGLLWVADGGLLETPDLALAGGAMRIGSAGTVCVGGSTAQAGYVSLDASGILSGFGSIYAQVANDGTLRAVGGVLAVYDVLAGNGIAQIAGGGELYLPYGAGPEQQIAFEADGDAAPGTIELFGSAATFAAKITGFGAGDTVDIASGTVTQASWAPGDEGAFGVLDLGTAGTLELTLATGVNAATASFVYSPDGLGGTAITLVPCFCAGTRLAASDGDVAVEDVAVGDRLLTRGGAARRVRWIGRQAYEGSRLHTDPQLRPVRIRAGALGKGRPRRDLWLSPQHAVALATPSGLRLIPAIALVDGHSVRREPAGLAASYVHIELDSHDLLMAEGVAVESFLANGPERRTLFQQSSGNPPPPSPECCPRLEGGQELAGLRANLGLFSPAALSGNEPGIRGHLDAVEIGERQLRIEGWAVADRTGMAPVSLDVLLDGAPYARIMANHWRPDLEKAGIAGGACAFRTLMPCGDAKPAGRLTIQLSQFQG